ncbi:helix-turn-helix domain-containing protein [Frateuria sp. GZRe14]|uniref:helix-turn-helix domain-containing protein n=1 Tax=Frateuria sp. GZRe14 TaxID=3351534 RepID=UPI003EDC643F
MSATLELLTRYKQALAMHADSAAAQALGVKNQTVSNWRTRGSQAEPWLIEKMCAVLGEATAPWLLRVQFEQASDASNKQVWRRVAQHFGFKLAGIATIAGLPGLRSALVSSADMISGEAAGQALLAILGDWLLF